MNTIKNLLCLGWLILTKDPYNERATLAVFVIAALYLSAHIIYALISM
jgi:hypothetical protein